ncbi:OOP family OmpA-OmpF porin [Pseudoduganella flava]|uniref:OOP family OmpA-OmpF porin n=1 Tax=Pseudoduganella flava TaxID=871742 RepID=A0A562PNE9_9BURK|nr:outer membrane beta-barrel protein [Pseudoduganella flava]QGZ40504.1 outer membrane beta-barrel protein [Pseudoduganella flava]TWI45947.1 OOP family OmpA-OmpF porin [Pseudoduganella flava]
MKNTILALVASIGALGAVSAHAADGRPYVGVGAVVAEHKYELNNDTTSNDRKSNEWGGKFFAGYEINPNWAVEAGYTDFGKNDYAYTVNGVNGRVESDAKSFYLAGKYTYPVANNFNVFGKLGVAHNKNDVSATGLAAAWNGDSSKNTVYASLGAEYAINQNVALSLEYEHYGKNDNDLGRRKGAVTLGARYSF